MDATLPAAPLEVPTPRLTRPQPPPATAEPLDHARPVAGADLEELPTAPLELAGQLLRDRTRLTAAVLADRGTSELVTGLTAITAVAAGAFGLAVGLQGGAFQAAMSAVKLPLVLLGAAGISLPILHLSCGLSGLRLELRQLSALVLHALATSAVTMAGLAPLVVVVWLTVSAFPLPLGGELCTDGGCDGGWYAYRRVVLATVGVAALGGLAGASRLLRIVPLRAALPWTVAFGLAGVQLSWLLRPLVGMPEGPLVILRPLESSGLHEILVALWAVLT